VNQIILGEDRNEVWEVFWKKKGTELEIKREDLKKFEQEKWGERAICVK
jgi:hypothetical protein